MNNNETLEEKVARLDFELGLEDNRKEVAISALVRLLAAISKATEGCNESDWAGYENGNGEECGEMIDLAIKNARDVVCELARVSRAFPFKGVV